ACTRGGCPAAAVVARRGRRGRRDPGPVRGTEARRSGTGTLLAPCRRARRARHDPPRHELPRHRALGISRVPPFPRQSAAARGSPRAPPQAARLGRARRAALEQRDLRVDAAVSTALHRHRHDQLDGRPGGTRCLPFLPATGDEPRPGEAHHVRFGSDGVARCHRPRARGRRCGRLPHAGAETRRLLRERRAIPPAARGAGSAMRLSHHSARHACALSTPMAVILLAAGVAAPPAGRSAQHGARPNAPAERIAPNDNRRPAGRLANGVLTLRLEARNGTWYPDGADGLAREVAAFAEEGGPLQNPGPLIRVPAGTEVRVTVRNSLERPLTMFGLGSTRGIAADSFRIEPGEAREMRITAAEPGT